MPKINDLYIYEVSPMDFGWETLVAVDDYRKIIADEVSKYDPRAADEFENFYKRAIDAGDQIGWEGDFRTGPCVAPIPDHDSAKLSLVWKQDNNGTTFIASEVPLPHLDE